VVLPDGTSMFVPAEWTICQAEENETASASNRHRSKCARIFVGSLSDFIRARKVVDGLLNRQVCLDHEPDNSIRRTDCYAAETGASGINQGTASGAAKAEPGRTRKVDSRTRESNGKSNRTKSNRGGR
jgi:hypothetical protein